MTNTNEAFKRYCESHGPCNRVVFDMAFDMGRESRDVQLKTLVNDWENTAQKTESEWYNDSAAYLKCADDLRTVLE